MSHRSPTSLGSCQREGSSIYSLKVGGEEGECELLSFSAVCFFERRKERVKCSKNPSLTSFVLTPIWCSGRCWCVFYFKWWNGWASINRASLNRIGAATQQIPRFPSGFWHFEWKWPLSFKVVVLGILLLVSLEEFLSIPELIRTPRFPSPLKADWCVCNINVLPGEMFWLVRALVPQASGPELGRNLGMAAHVSNPGNEGHGWTSRPWEPSGQPA